MSDIVERLRAQVENSCFGLVDAEAADEIERLRAEIAEAKDGWHMANGVADLAMKHRDEAEAERDRLRELLREARSMLVDDCRGLGGRIKAALKEGS